MNESLIDQVIELHAVVSAATVKVDLSIKFNWQKLSSQLPGILMDKSLGKGHYKSCISSLSYSLAQKLSVLVLKVDRLIPNK